MVQLNREEDEVGLEQYMCSFNTQVGVLKSAVCSDALGVVHAGLPRFPLKCKQYALIVRNAL